MANLKIKEDLSSSTSVGNILPQVGYIMMYAGNITQTSSAGVITTTAPSGWLLCNGDAFSSTLYPRLFSILNSATNLPDLRNKFLAGVTSTATTVGTITGSDNHAHVTTAIANTSSAWAGTSHNHNFAAHNADTANYYHTHQLAGVFNMSNFGVTGLDATGTGTVNAIGQHTHPISGNQSVGPGQVGGTGGHGHGVAAVVTTAGATMNSHTHESSTGAYTYNTASSFPATRYFNFIIKADI